MKFRRRAGVKTAPKVELAYAAPQLIPVTDPPLRLASGDVDGDGDLDLATAGANEGALLLLGNQGTGQFDVFTRLPLPPQEYANSIIFADVNGDGSLDIVVGTGSSVVVYRNTGLGVFAPG